MGRYRGSVWVDTRRTMSHQGLRPVPVHRPARATTPIPFALHFAFHFHFHFAFHFHFHFHFAIHYHYNHHFPFHFHFHFHFRCSPPATRPPPAAAPPPAPPPSSCRRGRATGRAARGWRAARSAQPAYVIFLARYGRGCLRVIGIGNR